MVNCRIEGRCAELAGNAIWPFALLTHRLKVEWRGGHSRELIFEAFCYRSKLVNMHNPAHQSVDYSFDFPCNPAKSSSDFDPYTALKKQLGTLMREKDYRWNQHITHLWFSATWVVATDVGKQPGARVAVLAKMLVHQVASVHEVQVQGCWSGWAWSVPAAGQAAAAPIKPDRRQLSAGPRSPARNAQLCTEHLPRGEKNHFWHL